MIVIDHDRCGYCGGCVSVCPVDAIRLAETHLMIDARCIDCELCVPACPVGALNKRGTERNFRPGYDMVVVGAGPAGSIAAGEAARRGLSVLLIEKRQEIGSPVRCAEGVRHEPLATFIEPDRRWIAATITKERVFTVQDGREREAFCGSGGEQRGYILERRLFDRVLAEEAARAGAQVMVKTSAIDLLRDGSTIRGVMVEFEGSRFEVEAKIVIGADGVESRVARWARLPLLTKLRDTLVCAQFTLVGIEIDPACCEYYLGDELAPGGYAWVFPKGEGKANVGLGVQPDLANETALEYLHRFIETRPHLAQGSPVTLIVGNVPTDVSPSRIVADGCMVVGDAAHQADPITAGGITNAMLAGRLAAEVAAEAVSKGDVSARVLEEYQHRWHRTLGHRMERNYRRRWKYAGQKRTSDEFVRLFAIAAATK
jgi:digeranylgeranylglycerophospholipid reductase